MEQHPLGPLPARDEVASGRVLLDLWGTDWDAWPSFPRAGTVRLSFRRYHFGGRRGRARTRARERYVLYEGAGGDLGPLADLPQALEDPRRGRPRSAAPTRRTWRGPPRSWLVALLILAGAAGLIAAATLVTLRLQGDAAAQRLDTIPPMPRRSWSGRSPGRLARRPHAHGLSVRTPGVGRAVEDAVRADHDRLGAADDLRALDVVALGPQPGHEGRRGNRPPPAAAARWGRPGKSG